MHLAMPQARRAAPDTVEKLELFAHYDTLYDECRAEIQRASSPSSVYSDRRQMMQGSSGRSTSPSSVYSERPTPVYAPSIHQKHKFDLSGALSRNGSPRPAKSSMSILDSNPATAPVTRLKMPSGKYAYSVRIPERTISKYKLLGPPLSAFPAPPAPRVLMGKEKGMGKGKSVVRPHVPERESRSLKHSKHPLFTPLESESDEQYVVRQRQVLLEWRSEMWGDGERYQVRWVGLESEKVRSLRQGKGKGRACEKVDGLVQKTPMVEAGCASRLRPNAKEIRARREVATAKVWAKGVPRILCCEGVERGGARHGISMAGL